MTYRLERRLIRRVAFGAAAAVALGLLSATASAGSPEDEIDRLNRVRQSLFEDLVKTRAEAAAARSELESMTKARDQAEAELARLRQELASIKPATQPRQPDEGAAVTQNRPAGASTDASRKPAPVPATTASLPSKAVPKPPPRVAAPVPQRPVARPAAAIGTRAAASNAVTQQVPNAMRLQDLR